MKIIEILFIFIIFIYQTNNTSQSCSFDTAIRDNQLLLISNFDNFSQLSFNCPKPLNMSMLKLNPTRKIFLDDSLNFNQTKITSTQNLFSIILYHIKGFDLKSNPFKTLKLINYPENYIFWTLTKTDMNFYYKNMLIDEYCNITLLDDNYWSSFLFKASIVQFELDLTYSDKMCPLIFRNSLLRFLKIILSSSFINRKLIKFQNINDDENKLNSTINQYLTQSFLLSKNIVLAFD